MIKSFAGKFKTLTLGILLPIFLFSTAFFVPAHRVSAGNSSVRVIFKTQALEEVSHDYRLSGMQKVFGESQASSLSDIYSASASSEDFARMASDARIAYAENNFAVEGAAILPSDPYFTNDPSFDDKQWYLPKIRMPEAWDFAKGTGNVVVAIIDTGIHASHLELNDGRIISGYDTIDSKQITAGANSDDNGHGTAVSGIIGAITNNSLGIAGINWNIKLMPIKALSADGTGEVADIAEGIVWAADHGANIINLSLGGPGFGADEALNTAVRYANSLDVVIVAAAGNDLADQGLNLDTDPIYPICADNGQNMIIGVAASDIDDKKANFSNFGINCVDITAPGKKILTTAYLPTDPSNKVLIYGSGTSVAAPIVSGVAALLKSSNYDLTNNQIRDIITGTADNIDALNQTGCLHSSCSGFLGKGRINALAALSPQPIISGSFIRAADTGKIYQINGGIKQYVSDFVFQQRGFTSSQVRNEFNGQLAYIPVGDPIPPMDGTLIKSVSNPTVYYIHQGLKRPLTFLVFNSRNFSFADVKTLPDADVVAVKEGQWYWPPDGTMVLINGNPTVYVMDQGVKRPLTFFVFKQRNLTFTKVIKVTDDEFFHIPPAPDAYWLAPLEGTLVKSASSPAVYLIKDASRKPLSPEAFANRKYKFSSIITLPQAEVDVILPGSPILN